jgi:hypothetical protein
MAYYSLVAFAHQETIIRNPFIAIGQGVNVFTVVTEDITNLLKILHDEHVDVKELYSLDADETIIIPQALPAFQDH